MALSLVGQFFGDGLTKSYSLPTVPSVGEVLVVELDGVEVSDWSLSGTYLTFTEAIDANTVVSVYRKPNTAGQHNTGRAGRRAGGPLFSMIGDSRTADLLINPQGKTAKNWFNWACAYYKQVPQLVACYGVSQKRTDEYLTNGNLEKAIADSSGTVIFGYPAVNDLGGSVPGYTDTYGRAVTVANVAALASGNLIRAVMRVIAEGKRAIVLLEPGSNAHNTDQVGATHEFNRLVRDALMPVKGVTVYNPCPVLWASDGIPANAGKIAFKAGYMADGQTHCGPKGGKAVGKDFATKVLPSLLPLVDTSVGHSGDCITYGVGQLFTNPLLINTTPAGTNTANISVSGDALPSFIKLGASVAGLVTAVASVTTNADGYGKDLTLTFTASAAVSGYVDFTLANPAADWVLTDQIQAGVDVDLAAGATNTALTYELQLNDNTGTASCYDLYSTDPWGGTAESLCLRSLKSHWNPAATVKGWVLSRLHVIFTAAGTATITVRRASIYRYR
ncbi:hypothetical protein [Aquabacterium sp.]|uniref:hypothetical protein n=1 Tax=Aquabacterium sp. TaxID=1872578 RepID=UPI00403783CA